MNGRSEIAYHCDECGAGYYDYAGLQSHYDFMSHRKSTMTLPTMPGEYSAASFPVGPNNSYRPYRLTTGGQWLAPNGTTGGIAVGKAYMEQIGPLTPVVPDSSNVVPLNTDAETMLDNIEQHVSMWTKAFYNAENAENQTSIASFALGLIAGELMKRNKP